MIDRNAGSQDLHDELRQGVQRHDIVHHAQHDDHRRAKQNSLHLPVNVRKDQSRQQKRQKDGKAAQTRNRHLVHAPVILRHVDRAYLVGEAFHHRR